MKTFSDADTKQNDRLDAVENKSKANSFAIKVLTVIVTAAITFGFCVLVAS